MQQDGAYFVDLELPEAALLKRDGGAQSSAPAARAPSDCGAIWYRGQAGAMAYDSAGRIQSWMSEAGETAYPVRPNQGGGGVHPSGGMAFETGINGGFVLEDALPQTGAFTCAVRFESPGGEARTLVTINPKDQDNYLFLSEKNGEITWQGQKGMGMVECPGQRGAVWALASFSHGQLCLTVAAEGVPFPPALSARADGPGLAESLSGPSDLFIGCRSHRKGILKTLGQSRIHDVLLWPDLSCLTPDGLPHDDLLAACRHAETQGAPQ